MPTTIVNDPVTLAECRDAAHAVRGDVPPRTIRHGGICIADLPDGAAAPNRAAMTVVEWSARIVAMADALSVPDGGFSINPDDGAEVRTGFAVSVHPEYERTLSGSVTTHDLLAYITWVSSVLSLPGRVLGGWRDPDAGRAYLDVSVVIGDLADAMSLARANAQLAIFDFARLVSIPVISCPAVGR